MVDAAIAICLPPRFHSESPAGSSKGIDLGQASTILHYCCVIYIYQVYVNENPKLNPDHNPGAPGEMIKQSINSVASHQQTGRGRPAQPLPVEEVVHRLRRVPVEVLGQGYQERVAGAAVVVVPLTKK